MKIEWLDNVPKLQPSLDLFMSSCIFQRVHIKFKVLKRIIVVHLFVCLSATVFLRKLSPKLPAVTFLLNCMLILNVLKTLWLQFSLPLANLFLVHYRKAKWSLIHAFLLLTKAFKLSFEKTSSLSNRSFKSLLKTYILYQLSHIRTLLYSISLMNEH